MTMTKTMGLSKRLKAYHARRSNELGYIISQRDLAGEFGVEPGLFNKHYNGTRAPEDPDMLARYAEKLGKEIYYELGVFPPDPIIATLAALQDSDDPEVAQLWDSIHRWLSDHGFVRTK